MSSLNLFSRVSFLILLGCCSPLISSAFAADNGVIVERKAYSFPSYEEAVRTTDVEKYADRFAYEKAVNDGRFELQKLKYMSDGLKVVAYLYKPKHTAGRRFPTIVFNRGSAVRGDIAPELVSIFHRLASEGFVILAPMLRQSDGGEGRDELGGTDVDDLMNIVPLAKSLRFADMDNVFMYGESRGGMMTFQAVKNGFPIKAAAVFGAFTDLREVVDSHPQQFSLGVLRKIWPDFEEQKDEIFKTRSAILWTDRLTVPLLIMHGAADKSVNPEQSLTLAQELLKRGRVFELLVYAEDNHILSNNREDRDRRAIGWFKKHIKR